MCSAIVAALSLLGRHVGLLVAQLLEVVAQHHDDGLPGVAPPLMLAGDVEGVAEGAVTRVAGSGGDGTYRVAR